MLLKEYDGHDAEAAIRKALEGSKVFELATALSTPRHVEAVLDATAARQGVELDLRLAPGGVLIARATRVAT